MMLAAQLRQSFLDYFRDHGHAVLQSAPLVPENDPTVLFTTAGMHPLVPYLMGARHPAGQRLCNCQKCMRTGDIEEVGDTTHLTFFEMLGNWSLGDYFKEEAIAMSFEYLTRHLNFPAEKLWISCFAGDSDAPRDDEAAAAWQALGIPAERIGFLGKEHNWWGPAGQTGPCGPDTEMFFEREQEPCGPDCGLTCNCGRFVEIWNDVFMQYNRTASGTYEPLQQCNVDTGMGVERVTAILQNKQSCFETELFTGILNRLGDIAGTNAELHMSRGARIIAEHVRAAAFLMADGVRPGNVDQAYVLRRLIRRAVREGKRLGVNGSFTVRLAETVIADYRDVYPELEAARNDMTEALEQEEQQFASTLERGIREFNKLLDSFPDHVERKIISGRKAFYLYETFGFPLELTREMARERGFLVDENGYQKAYKKHQELSRAGASQRFKGGLADDSARTAALHTATHLLQAALRRVLGDHVTQAGSNITADRLRFDFTHGAKMTPEERAAVEQMVNDSIQADIPVECRETTLDGAAEMGAIGLFQDRYGDRVTVYQIQDTSMEVCGGPHAERTGQLGRFRILKEESSSRGVRRIKAVLE